jgi:hypothetical protein
MLSRDKYAQYVLLNCLVLAPFRRFANADGSFSINELATPQIFALNGLQAVRQPRLSRQTSLRERLPWNKFAINMVGYAVKFPSPRWGRFGSQCM